MKEEILNEVLIIGITGGFGSGKSSVANIIKESGYPVIFTDKLAKEILFNDKNVKSRLIEKFGKNIYFDDGNPNTELISKFVFSDNDESKKNLNTLNSIVHPPVISEMIKEIEKMAALGFKTIFVESALIYEAGLDEGFDYIIDVDTKDDIKIDRLVRRTGLKPEQIQQRMNEQLSPQYKKEISDFVIENNTDIEALRKSTGIILDIVTNLPKKDFAKKNFDNS